MCDGVSLLEEPGSTSAFVKIHQAADDNSLGVRVDRITRPRRSRKCGRGAQSIIHEILHHIVVSIILCTNQVTLLEPVPSTYRPGQVGGIGRALIEPCGNRDKEFILNTPF